MVWAAHRFQQSAPSPVARQPSIGKRALKESPQATILGRAGHQITSLFLLELVSFLRFTFKRFTFPLIIFTLSTSLSIC